MAHRPEREEKSKLRLFVKIVVAAVSACLCSGAISLAIPDEWENKPGWNPAPSPSVIPAPTPEDDDRTIRPIM